MQLNNLRPAPGAKRNPKRVGRGIGCGSGKTCGRGHKGQKARSGGSVKPGFEGGQMPLQRRVPKFGFTSRKSLCREQLRVSDLLRVDGDVITIASLKASGVIRANTKHVKVFAAGEINKAVTLQGIKVTNGAKVLIEAQGGKVED